MDLGIGGKVAIVTGGSQASARRSPLQLAAEGVRTVISARNFENLKQAPAEITSATKGEVLPAASRRDRS